MAFENCSSEKELQKVSKSFIPLSGTSLASLESLSLPLVQEVVLSADMQCEECRKRVSDIITKMNETESIVVNVLEKKVILTFRISSTTTTTTIGKEKVIMSKKVTPINNSKGPIIKRIFRSFVV